MPREYPQSLLAVRESGLRVVEHDVGCRPVTEGVRLAPHSLRDLSCPFSLARGFPSARKVHLPHRHQEATVDAVRVALDGGLEELLREGLVSLTLVPLSALQVTKTVECRRRGSAGGALGTVRHISRAVALHGLTNVSLSLGRRILVLLVLLLLLPSLLLLLLLLPPKGFRGGLHVHKKARQALCQPL